MDFKTLEFKTKINSESNTYLDLHSKTFEVKYSARIEAYHVVLAEQQMRPDLISKLHYGSSDYVDGLLKYNGITNPFGIKTGDIIVIPRLLDLKSYYIKPPESNVKSTDIKKQYTDIDKLSEVDKTRLEYLKEKSSAKSNGSSENIPTNLLKAGESVFESKNGEIIIAPQISK